MKNLWQYLCFRWRVWRGRNYKTDSDNFWKVASKVDVTTTPVRFRKDYAYLHDGNDWVRVGTRRGLTNAM